MRYALVAGGAVVNVVEIDPEGEWSPPEGHQLIASEVADIGDGWDGEQFIKPIVEAPPVDLAEYAARRRWEIIEAGHVVVDGVAIPSDSGTRNIVTAAYIQAKANPEYVVDPWKVGPRAYVMLTAAQVIAIGDALSAYVQSMFARNRTVDDEIEAGAITTTAEVDAAFAAA